MTRLPIWFGVLISVAPAPAQSIILEPVLVFQESEWLAPAPITSYYLAAPTVQYYVPARAVSPPRIERYYFQGTPAPRFSGSGNETERKVNVSGQVIIREYYFESAGPAGSGPEAETVVPKAADEDRPKSLELPPPDPVIDQNQASKPSEAGSETLPKPEAKPPVPEPDPAGEGKAPERTE